MNYIYDILLNFNTSLYDFYEWNDNDDITHIRKMPVFKVNTQMIEDIKHHKIEVESKFLNKIKSKTEMFQKKSIKQIEYACLFTNGKECIAVLLQANMITLKSRLLLDEEEDVLDMSATMEEIGISYKKIGNIFYCPFQTRKESEMKKYIQKELSKITDDGLEYLYYECFNERPGEGISLKCKIKERLTYDFDNTAKKLYDFFKLLGTKK